MLRPIAKCVLLGVLPAACLMADFSYEQTTKITGGAMASMVKFAGAFSKQMREPVRSVVAVKGDRMVNSTPQQASIIDLGKETITEINYQKKQYSVMTFAEMAQMLEELSRKNKDKKGPDFQIKVEANETGQTRQIGAYNTKEVILKIIMESQAENGQKGGMTVTVDSWMAPPVAGYNEIADFYKRMSQKLSWAPGGGMMTMGNPDAAKAMAEIYKEGSKLSGLPILQVITMGGAFGPGNQGGAPAGQEQATQQQAAQTQEQPQQQAQAEKPSLGGALGGALGGRLGRFGGLGRKKNQDAQQQAQQQQAQQQQAQQQQQQQQQQAAAAQQQRPAGAPGSLMEATSEFAGFSAAPIDPAKFEVPAGFKQVQPDKKMR